MREYYVKDKHSNKVVRIIKPQDDVNWPPFDFFRYSHAELQFQLFNDRLKLNCPYKIPEKKVRTFVLDKVDELIEEKLKATAPKPEIHQLLTDGSLSYKQQKSLLNNVTFSSIDVLWLNREAQDLGYLLDIYHEEKFPEKFEEKQKPAVFIQNEDKSIELMGTTNMTDGEMRSLLEQRKVVQARIYHKDNHWHCFYFTYKGLAGEEGGVMGSKPHYHYLSDKSGITWEELLRRIKDCNMPSSKVHIVIEGL